MNQTYEQRERALFNAQVADLAKQSLADRKNAQVDALGYFRHPQTVAERVQWLLCGNYGHGAMQVALEVAANSRMNRAAWFAQTLVALDCQCPYAHAVKAWKDLNAAQQDALNAAILASIADFAAEQVQA